jgi:hypothetical protein
MCERAAMNSSPRDTSTSSRPAAQLRRYAHDDNVTAQANGLSPTQCPLTSSPERSGAAARKNKKDIVELLPSRAASAAAPSSHRRAALTPLTGLQPRLQGGPVDDVATFPGHRRDWPAPKGTLNL